MTAAPRRRKKVPLSRPQAAVSLLVFCVLAVITAVVIWKGVRAIRDYYARNERYDPIIEAAGLRNGVDPALLKAVIWKESRFDRYVIGSKGEIGLMQIMPQFAATEWARVHRVNVPGAGLLSDPELNIEIGSWYLGRALRRWDGYRERTVLALCEYNAGGQRAAAWKPDLPDGTVLDRISISSTLKYVNEILEKQKAFRRDFQKSDPREPIHKGGSPL